MDFEYSPKVRDLRERLMAFMDQHVYPIEKPRNKGKRWNATRRQRAQGWRSKQSKMPR